MRLLYDVSMALMGPRFLYAMYISTDANFRLTSKNRKLDDVELAPGKAYFVDNQPYMDFVSRFGEQKEVQLYTSSLIPSLTPFQDNTCAADHDAIKRANTRNKEGWLASGVGGTTCARHTLIRKCGMGDLQKGGK